MRQFRVNRRSTGFFNYTKLYHSSDKAHLIEVQPGNKFWIPKAWIKKIDKKNRKIHVKEYWIDEIKLKLKGIVK